MTRCLLLFSLMLCIHVGILAQSSAGTLFWLGYMENLTLAFNDAPAFSVIINADAPTSGSIDVPATGLSIPFSAPSGSTEIFLPAAVYYSEGSEQIDNKGLRITADAPVRVQAYHYRLFFSESSNVLPVTELGTEYLITSIVDEAGPAQPGSLVIVATQDNTEVEITPSTLTLGLRPAGVPFTVTLSTGQNYQIQALGELTGTRVRSLGGQPLAVFSGSQQADIIDGTCNGGADSHVWDQSLPLEDWRELYYFVPFSGQGGDRVKIVAAEDNTTLFFDCESVALLDRGDFFSTLVTEATVISSTAPVSVTQYTNNFSCEPSQAGDPNGLSYLPADFVGTSFRWLASNRMNNTMSGFHFDQHYVTILGPAEATDNVILDGSLVSGFVPFTGNPAWEYTRVQVGPGAHELQAAEGVQAYSYGFGFADSYTNHLGYTAIIPQDYACLDIERSGILCVDSLQQFTFNSNLNLTDFSWDFGDATGSSLPEPTHTYTSAGTYEVVLTATDPAGTMVSASLMLTVVDCEEDPCNPANAQISPLVTGIGCALYLQTFSYSADFTPTSISWDFGDGSETVSTAEADHFYAAAGIYTVTLTLGNALGCEFITTQTVTIEDCEPCFDQGTVALSVDGELCPGEVLQFSSSYAAIGVPPFEVQWSFSDGQVFSELNPEVSFANPGEYTVDFFLFNSLGCLYDGSLIFTIENCGVDCNENVNIGGFALPVICAGEMVNFTANSPATITEYFWSIEGQTFNTPSVTYLFEIPGPTEVLLSITTEDGCVYSDNVVLQVNDCTSDCSDLIIEDIVIGGSLCVDSTITLTGIYASDEPVDIFWVLLPTFETFQGDALTTSFSEPGEYSFIFVLDQITTNCEAETTVTITIEECLPDCSTFQLEGFTVEGTLCRDSLLLLTPSFSTPPDSIVWQLPSGEMRNTLLLDNFSASVAGPYPIALEAYWDNGCQVDTVLTLNVEDCLPPPVCEVMIPNIFSPNEDGVNDRFRLFYADECLPTDFELFVYNRWGSEVYRSQDPTASWDGRFKGQPHPQEVLVYWCRFQLPDGSVEERKGDVTLIR